MLETRITCDGCTASLAPSGPVPGFLITLRSESIPVLGDITAAVHVEMPIGRTHHFCGLRCLRKWLDARRERSSP